MPSEIGNLSDIAALCTWLGCERTSDMRVVCRARSSKGLPRGLPWERIGVDWQITLCNDHAARLALLAGPDFLLSIRQLPTS